MTILYCVLSFVGGAVLLWLVYRTKVQASLAHWEETAKQRTKEAADAATRVAELEKENREISARDEADRREITLLRAQIEKTQREQQEKFETQLRVAEQRIQNLAVQVLERQSEKLKDGNAEQMQHVTAPLRETIRQMQEALSRTDRMTAESKASLSEQIRQLVERL